MTPYASIKLQKYRFILNFKFQLITFFPKMSSMLFSNGAFHLVFIYNFTSVNFLQSILPQSVIFILNPFPVSMNDTTIAVKQTTLSFSVNQVLLLSYCAIPGEQLWVLASHQSLRCDGILNH